MKKNWLEWIVFFSSLALILSLIGYLVYQIFAYEEKPPNFHVSTIIEEQQAQQYTVRVVLENRGGQTAESVNLEVLLLKDEQELDRATLTIGYAPKGSTMEGWVTFKSNPALADTLVARVLGYNKP